MQIAGVGKHLDVIFATDPATLVKWAKCGIASEQLYCTAVVFPKLSMLASYLRFFAKRTYRNTAYILGALIVANGIAGVAISFGSCRPISAGWTTVEDRYVSEHCIDIVAYWRWISFPNILTDIVMLFLPLPIIWGLHLSQRERIGVSLILLTGSM